MSDGTATRAQRAEATRLRLLDATVEVVTERGFHSASVEEIAHRAGYTIGALYHKYPTKEALFLAAFDRGIADYVGRFVVALDEEASPTGRNRAAAEVLADFTRRESTLFVLYLEFMLYASRRPGLRAQVAQRFGALRDACARMVTAEAAAGGWELPAPASELAVTINALSNGFALALLLDPDGVPDGLYASSLASLMASFRDRPQSR
jgi:AcrR family transcriptional regulator